MTVGSSSFDIRSEWRGSHALITVRGELDLATRSQLREHLEWVIADSDGDSDVNLDLAGVGYIDSSGVCEILTAQSTLVDQHRNLRVVKASRQVARLFELCGITHLLADDEPGGTPTAGWTEVRGDRRPPSRLAR